MFNKEKVSISNLNTKTIINAFMNGLLYGSDLCKELAKFPWKNFKDMLAKAWAQIRLGEDKEYKISMGLPIKSNRESPNFPNRNDYSYFIPQRVPKWIYDSYSNGNCQMEYIWELRDSRKPYEKRDRAQERPKLPEYNLNIEPAKLVRVLKGTGEIVKWPQKMKSPLAIWDIRKLCEFY